ncbi:MAG: DUF2799 domain-containing protein [Pseudomonadota bacterium]
MLVRVVVGLIVTLSVVSGCAGLSEDQCQILNWEAEGRSAGQYGGGPTSYSRLASQCSRYAIVPDYAAFERGRQQGLVRFCTPEGAYIAGLSGRGSTTQCVGADPSLTLIHQTALNYSEAERELDRARNALERSIDDRNFARQEARSIRARLRKEEDPDKIDDLERELRYQLNRADDYEADEVRLLFDIADRERDLSRAQFDLDRVRAEFGLGFGPRPFF